MGPTQAQQGQKPEGQRQQDFSEFCRRSLLRGGPWGGKHGEPVKQAPDHVLCSLRATLRVWIEKATVQ